MKVNRALTDLTTDSQLTLLTKLVTVCERSGNNEVDHELRDFLDRYARCVTFNFATAKAKIAAKEAMDQEAFEAKKRRERLGEDDENYVDEEADNAAARAAQESGDDEYSGEGLDDGKYDGQGYPRATLAYSEPYPGLPSGPGQQQPTEQPAATSFSSFFPVAVMGSLFGASAAPVDSPVAPYYNDNNGNNGSNNNNNGNNNNNNNGNNNNGNPYPNNNNGRPDINGNNAYPPRNNNKNNNNNNNNNNSNSNSNNNNTNSNSNSNNNSQGNTPTSSTNSSNQNLPMNPHPNSSSATNGAPTPSPYPNVNLYGNPKPNPK